MFLLCPIIQISFMDVELGADGSRFLSALAWRTWRLKFQRRISDFDLSDHRATLNLMSVHLDWLPPPPPQKKGYTLDNYWFLTCRPFVLNLLQKFAGFSGPKWEFWTQHWRSRYYNLLKSLMCYMQLYIWAILISGCLM